MTTDPQALRDLAAKWKRERDEIVARFPITDTSGVDEGIAALDAAADTIDALRDANKRVSNGLVESNHRLAVALVDRDAARGGESAARDEVARLREANAVLLDDVPVLKAEHLKLTTEVARLRAAVAGALAIAQLDPWNTVVQQIADHLKDERDLRHERGAALGEGTTT